MNIFSVEKNEKQTSKIRVIDSYFEEENKEKMNLLVLEDKDESEKTTNKHLVLIKNFNSLINPTTHNKYYFCERCMTPFSSE